MQQKPPLAVRLSEIMLGRARKDRSSVVVHVAPGKQYAVEVLYKLPRRQIHV